MKNTKQALTETVKWNPFDELEKQKQKTQTTQQVPRIEEFLNQSIKETKRLDKEGKISEAYIEQARTFVKKTTAEKFIMWSYEKLRHEGRTIEESRWITTTFAHQLGLTKSPYTILKALPQEARNKNKQKGGIARGKQMTEQKYVRQDLQRHKQKIDVLEEIKAEEQEETPSKYLCLKIQANEIKEINEACEQSLKENTHGDIVGVIDIVNQELLGVKPMSQAKKIGFLTEQEVKELAGEKILV